MNPAIYTIIFFIYLPQDCYLKFDRDVSSRLMMKIYKKIMNKTYMNLIFLSSSKFEDFLQSIIHLLKYDLKNNF